MNRRVVVTGYGLICSLGNSVEEFWGNCLDGHLVVQAIPDRWRLYSEYRSTIWSPLPHLNFSALGFPRIEILQNDPVSLLSLYSAQRAVMQAGFVSIPDKQSDRWSVNGIETSRVGVFMGTGVGGANSFLENHCHAILARQKEALQDVLSTSNILIRERKKLEAIDEKLYCPRRVSPFVVSMLMPNAVSATLSLELSISGPTETYCVACASGTVAIGRAFQEVRNGSIDVALAGGAEYLEDHYGYIFKGFDSAGTLIKDCKDPLTANRPFDVHRSGFLFSQGAAAVLVLEDLETARRRGANILGEIVGFGESSDAHSMMRVEPTGRQIERMIALALDVSKLSPEQVDYVNAHGTGTENNDQIEADVLSRVFRDRPLVNSSKSLLGHTIGASGALEAVVCLLSLKHQTTHVCANLNDPIADLNFVRDVKKREINVAFSQSFAFGGHNAGIVFKRYNG